MIIDPAPLTNLFDIRRRQFAAFLETIDAYTADLWKIGANTPPEPRWDQVWFPRLDAAAAYTMVREYQPARIVEVGSGHSTRFMARAIRDGGLATTLTSIDPQPRATLDGLTIERIARPVQDVDILALDPGDILFIDSSHVRTPGSDVDHLIRHILPSLPGGVLIHFHDIFLPDPYPPEWDYRRYNEHDAVAELLASNMYEVIFASRYVTTRMADQIVKTCLARLPLKDSAFENSLWLRKR